MAYAFTFFSRYGVADKKMIVLNAVLLFVVLYLAYPLRFAFETLFAFIMLLSGDVSRAEVLQLDYGRSGNILGFFGFGFMVVHVVYFLMHRHVLRKSQCLEITQTELQITRQSIFYHCGVASLAIVIGSLAYFTPLIGFAGFILTLTGVISVLGRKKYPVPKTP